MTDNEPITRPEQTRVGDMLKKVREDKGFALADIAEKTRVPLRHLEAIETSQYDNLPANTYSRGFVKAYASALGLDAAPIAEQFQAEISDAQPYDYGQADPYEPNDPSRVPPRLIVWIGLAAAVLLIIGYMLWRNAPGMDERLRAAAGTQPEEVSADAVSEPALDAAPQAPVVVAKNVVLTAVDEVWLKVSEREGKSLFMGTLKKGERYDVPADAVDPVILTGRPEAVSVTVGNVVIPPLGQPSRTIKNVSLKADSLLEVAKTAPNSPSAAAGPQAAPANRQATAAMAE